MEKQFFHEPLVETDRVEVLSNKLIMITNELTKANQSLARSQREKNDMIANISHDLRAPLTAIRSAVDLLLSGQELSSYDIKSALSLIDCRTSTLETMVQDMYTLFTLEDSELPLHLEAISAAPFFEEYFYNAILDHRYDEKNMHLSLPSNLNLIIDIDIQNMVRVLDNLLTNAAKYSPPNSDITLSVQANPDKSALIIAVTDTGIGIPEDCLSKIFDRTYTVSTSRTPSAATGSGLGLSIVKTIVEKHHGQVSCQSEVGKGTTFTVILPVKIER